MLDVVRVCKWTVSVQIVQSIKTISLTGSLQKVGSRARTKIATKVSVCTVQKMETHSMKGTRRYK